MPTLYDTLSETKTPQKLEGGYQHKPKKDFYYLQSSEPVALGPWKLHLSVHPADLAKAWDLVAKEVIADKGVTHLVKVSDPSATKNFMADPASSQAGKMITLYTDKNVPPEKYAELTARIEKQLQQAGVRPGPQVHADRPLGGGKYTSYRAESGGDGKYLSSEDLMSLPKEQRYNLAGLQDPYAKIDLSKPQTYPQKVAPAEEGRVKEHIGRAPWRDVKSGAQRMKVLEISEMPPFQRAMLEDSLKKAGVRYSVHQNSKIVGGKPELIVQGDDYGKVHGVQLDLQRQTVLNAPWKSVVGADGKRSQQIDLTQMSVDERNRLQLALQREGVVFDVGKNSPQAGGGEVLRVSENNLQTLEKVSVRQQKWGQLEGRAGFLAGVLLMGVAGLATAAQPDSSAEAIAHSALAAGLPGYDNARQGDLCGTFGALAGFATAGLAMAATGSVVIPAAITATAASGPAAPVVGPAAGFAATGAVMTAGALGHDAVAEPVRLMCESLTKAAKRARHGLSTP